MTLTTREVLDALKAKYEGKDERAWAGGCYLEECGINGHVQHEGQPVNSRVDAIYAGFTSASGRLLIGHEVKVSRSDWLGELKKVGKADFWHDNCHQWYLVIPRTEPHHPIVKDDELPEGWGLMIVSGSRVTTRIKAITRQVTPSWGALRSMLSRMETLRAMSVGSALQRAREENNNQIHQLQEQLREAQRAGGQWTEAQKAMRLIISTAEQRLTHAGVYGGVDVEDAITALVDAATLRSATQEAHRRLEHLIQNVNLTAAGISSAHGPLKKILEGMS